MPSGLMISRPTSAWAGRREMLRRFVQAFWLRPENAFWMTLRSETLAPYRFETPSLDLSCGDGVFSFLHQGGTFDPGFDVFTGTDAWNRVAHEPVDIFDFFTERYRPLIQSRPREGIDVGTDWKSTMLAKAERLGFYGRLVEHDHNRPLPFKDDAFRSVYCNAAYWVVNIDGFLREIRRITRPSGRIVLQVKLDSMRRYTLAAHRRILGDRFLDILGGGRLESWPTIADRATWEARFARSALSVEEVTPFVTRTHAHVWNVGLRPVAPLLMRMADALNPTTRSSIKRDWVDLVCELLHPLCDPGFDLETGRDDPAEVQYVLQPR